MRLHSSQTRATTGLQRFSPLRPAAALRPLLTSIALAVSLVAMPQAWANGPTNADSLPEIQRLIKQGQYPQALERVDAYIATRPKDAQGRFTKGLILTELNRPADAIVVFQRLTEDYPELPEPYNNLAVLYAQQKQYDKARTALEMAIRTHPAYATAHENLGDVYAKLASQAYDKALQIDSSNTGAQSKLSLIRELISVSGRPGSRPAAAAAAPTPAPAPAPAVSATTGAAPTVVARAEPAKPAAAPAPVAPPPKVVEKPAPAEKPEKAEKVEKAAEAKPAPKAEEKKADEAKAGSDEAGVHKAVQAWANAWSRKDVKAYLAAYAPDFQVPGGQKRKDWEAERSSRITKPGTIQVGVEDLKVSFQGDKATVRFRQNYKSANLKSSASKVLVLSKSGSRWLIQQERVGS